MDAGMRITANRADLMSLPLVAVQPLLPAGRDPAERWLGQSSMDKVEDRLVVVASFLEPNLAHIARSRLEAEGIQAALDGENHIAMDWFISNAIGGVKLLVHQRDAEEARRILSGDVAEIADEQSGDVPNGQESWEGCPECASPDVYPERVRRGIAYFSTLLLGFPLPVFSDKLACAMCGHRWAPTDAADSDAGAH